MEEYDLMMNVNTRSVFVLTQMCVPHLIKNSGKLFNATNKLNFKYINS